MPHRMLIVDTDPNVQDEIARIVRLYDLEIITASNAGEAFAKIESARPQLVLLNISLPGESGYELCSIIKADPRFGGIPVVLLSTKNEVDKDEASRVHANGDIRLPTAEADVERGKLLRLLNLGRRAPKTGLLRRTFVVWDLMAHRAAAILSGNVIEGLIEVEPSHRHLTQRDEQISDDLLRDTLRTILTTTELTSNLAVPLLDQLPNLLWVEIADQLIVNQSCELNDFGKFQLSGAGNALRVEFTAAPTLAEKYLPQLEFQEEEGMFRQPTVRSVVTRISREELTENLLQLLESEPKGDIAAKVLGKAVGVIMLKLLNDPVAANLPGDRRRIWSGSGRRNDLLNLLGQAAAQATYYVYLVNCAVALHAGSTIEVETQVNSRL